MYNGAKSLILNLFVTCILVITRINDIVLIKSLKVITARVKKKRRKKTISKM